MPFDEHVKLMLDLQVLAFKADVTRIATMMFSRDLSAKVYAESGVPDAYHALSHHQDDPIRMERYAKLNAYHVSVVGYFLDKLRNTPEGGSNLLDNSLVMFGSPMGNSNMHDHNDLPIFIAGTAAGRYEAQSAHRESEGHADRQLLHDAGREGRHRARQLRRQHGPDGRLSAAPRAPARSPEKRSRSAMKRPSGRLGGAGFNQSLNANVCTVMSECGRDEWAPGLLGDAEA